MEIRALEQFVAVAEEGGFTRASEKLHLVQSSVSATVKALERELGFRLFDRGTRSVRLTAQGKSFLPYARSAIDSLATTREVAASLADGLSGTVSVGVLVIPDMLGLAPVIARVHTAHPGVSIHVRTPKDGTKGLLADVASGELDLSFVVLPFATPPDVHIEPLASGGYTLACGPTHPWAGRRDTVLPDELDGAGFVDFPPDFSARGVIDQALLQRGIRRATTIEVGHLDLVATYIAAGVGIGFVTEQLAWVWPDLVPLETPWLDMRWTIAIARHRTRPLSRAGETFLEAVRVSVAERIASGLLPGLRAAGDPEADPSDDGPGSTV